MSEVKVFQKLLAPISFDMKHKQLTASISYCNQTTLNNLDVPPAISKLHHELSQQRMYRIILVKFFKNKTTSQTAPYQI